MLPFTNTAATVTLATPHVRWMVELDFPAVMEIERQSYLDPWTVETLRQTINHRNCIAMVAEFGDVIAAHMVYDLHPKSFALLRFAVAPSWRRQGVARAMVAKLVRKLDIHRRTRIVADLHERNVSGCLAARSLGFRAVRVLRGAADDGGDVYRMEWRLAP